MTWSKLDDNLYDHPKALEAGEPATDLFVRGLVYCNRYLTNGRIPKVALAKLSKRDGNEENASALVRAGLWEDDGTSWTVHDFLKLNPSREQIEERRADVSLKRSEAGKKGNEARWGTRREAEVPADDSRRPAIVGGARNTAPPTLLRAASRGAIATSQNVAPSRPVPNLSNTTEETPTVSLRSAVVVAHAPTQNDPTRVVPVVPPTAHTGGESRVVTLRLVPDAATPPVAPQRPTQPSMNPHPGASMQPSLFADPSQPTTAHAAPSEATDAPEPAPKPRSARKAPPSGEKAPKVKAPPKEKPPARGANPEQTIACVSALATAAGRRFAMGDFAMWHKIVKTNASKTVLDYPDVALWKLVGEALAANADGGYAVLGPSRVTTRWFSDQLCVAHEWVASGRQRPTDNRPFVAKTNAATSIPEGHRRYAPSAAQRLANATGKAVNSKMPTTFDDDDRDYDLSAPDCPVSLAR